jgi:hypothetical protein
MNNRLTPLRQVKSTGANSGIYFLIYDYIVAPVVLLWLQTDDKSLMRKRPDCDYNIHILTPPLVEILIITPTQPFKF